MAVLEPNSDDKTPKFFLEKDNNDENSGFDDELHITDSLEPSTGPIIKNNLKKTRYVHIPSVAIGAGIAISCLVLGIFLANFIDMENPQFSADISNVSGPDILIRNGSPILGNVDAPLTLVEFGDYQCSFCKRHFDQTHDLIMKNYVKTNKVKILFKDLIVTPGRDSTHAAHATHCAKDQGMFWRYHYMLYNNWEGENTGWVTTDNLNKFAQSLDLDMNKFSKCMSENKWIDLINASKEDANTLGITGTPSFFLIGPENELEKIHGAQSYEYFKEIFDSHLKK